MSVRPSSRLPRRFNRPISPVTRRLISRRHSTPFRNRFAARWRRLSRGAQRSYEGWRRTVIQWSLVALIGLVLLTGGIIIFSPIGRVEEVRVTRTDPRLDIDQVQRSLLPLFGRYLVAISGYEVQQLLEEKIPDLQSVTVGKRYPSQLNVRVELEPLIARLRILSPETKEGDPGTGSGVLTGYVTSHGKYVTVPLGAQDQAFPLLYLVDWGVRPESGVVLLSTDFLKRMREAEEILHSQFGQDVTRRTIYLRAEEFHLTMGKVSLWFDTRSTAEEQLQRYRMFLKAVGLGVAKQYIDLRLTDKVIYR